MKTPTKKQQQKKKRILIGAVIGSSVTAIITVFAYLTLQIYNQNQVLDYSLSQIARLQLSEMSPSLEPKYNAATNRLAIPELKASIPYNNVTRYLKYRDDEDSIRVSSRLAYDPTINRQMSCTDLVRLSSDKNVYDPWEKMSGSVVLNGKKIYVFEAIAFKNNEASTLDCESQVWRDEAKPSDVAKQMLKLHSY